MRKLLGKTFLKKVFPKPLSKNFNLRKERFLSVIKKIFFGMLAAITVLASFTGCSGDVSEETVSGNAAETTVNPYREDREVREDYKSIEISGEHDVRILFVNAGRADAILIEADGVHYLIDTGEETSVPKIMAALDYFEVERLEGVFLTHSNNDHISGLPMISDYWEIGACYTAAVATEMTKMQTVIGQAEMEQTLLEPGQVIQISDGLYFEVLGPIRYNPLDDNDNSLVLRMTVNGKTVLFAGDMQHEEEKTLMRAGFDLSCDILKVGNHGHKDATSVAFMEETSPDYAIITTDRSVDENTAHKSIRGGLADVGAEVLITDEYDLGILCEIAYDGAITMENVTWGHVSDDVEFVSISKDEQIAVLRNTGSSDLAVARWFIVSGRGGELFLFPDGAVIPAGGEITVACNDYKGDADYKWGDAKVWNKNKDDKGILIDRHGNVIDEMLSE